MDNRIIQTCCFIGHRDLDGRDLTPQIIYAAEQLIFKGVRVFLNGGMGDFDRQSAYVVRWLKKRYPTVQSLLIIPYLTFRCDYSDAFDEILYPDLETIPFKQAILRRNRFMVEESAYAISHVVYPWGGSHRTLQYAQKRGLQIERIT